MPKLYAITNLQYVALASIIDHPHKLYCDYYVPKQISHLVQVYLLTDDITLFLCGSIGVI